MTACELSPTEIMDWNSWKGWHVLRSQVAFFWISTSSFLVSFGLLAVKCQKSHCGCYGESAHPSSVWFSDVVAMMCQQGGSGGSDLNFTTGLSAHRIW